MDVPPVSHPGWKKVVSGKGKYQFEFVATNFLVGYLTLQVKRDSSPQFLLKCAQELHDIFVRNADLVSVQRDLIKIFGKDVLSGYLYEVLEVKSKIMHGEKLLLAGDESLLKQLPAGNWIGGSIPYFMTEEGGVTTKNKIYVTELPETVSDISINIYTPNNLDSVYTDAPRNGFSIIIMPGSSPTHLEFALRAPHYKDFGHSPLIGWIAGVHLDDLGKITPKVFYGPDQAMLEDAAVVIHAALLPKYIAEVNYVNIFEQGEGDTIIFPQDGFSTSEALINGVKTNYADYITKQNLDMRLPLVADYFGAKVNVSFQGVNPKKHEVQFYAPVFAGVSYKHAKPLKDYVQQFTKKIPAHLNKHPAFSCNCVLNYMYSELEGKRTGKITGPATFGEVVYQLLNQTVAYLTVTEIR